MRVALGLAKQIDDLPRGCNALMVRVGEHQFFFLISGAPQTVIGLDADHGCQFSINHLITESYGVFRSNVELFQCMEEERRIALGLYGAANTIDLGLGKNIFQNRILFCFGFDCHILHLNVVARHQLER